MRTKYDEIVWNNVVALSKRKGWSLVQLAKEAGTRPQALNNLKKGNRGIGMRMRAKLAIALGVDEAVLMQDPDGAMYLAASRDTSNDADITAISSKLAELRDAGDEATIREIQGIIRTALRFVRKTTNASTETETDTEPTAE